MKVNSLSAIKPLENIQFWLLAIGAGLIAIILTLSWRSGDPSHVGMSVLFFLAVASMLEDKKKSISVENEIFSSGIGALLIAFVLWQSAILTNDNKFLAIFTHISPFISALGLALIASGLKGLKQYWQELTILFFLGIPKVILTSVTDISPLTAKFSAFLLWYAGLEVNLSQGVYINLPTGSVKVYTGCSGAELISHLLGIAVICLLMFPIQRKNRFLVPITGVIFGFVVNGIRVALLAVITAHGNKQAFDYWHEGNGSRLFGVIAVLTLCLFYLFLLKQEESKKIDIRKS